MNYKLRKLVMIAIACSFVAGSTTQATGFDSTSPTSLSGAALMYNARLSIRRAADFGTDIYLSLFIDGIHVATLGANEGYEATVRPGGTSCPQGPPRIPMETRCLVPAMSP